MAARISYVRLLCGIFFVLLISPLYGENNKISIIPAPKEYKLGNGYFSIDSTTLFSGTPHERICYIIDSTLSDLGDEGYMLDINSSGIVLKASSDAGLFYAKKTLQQLYSGKGLPYITIKDKPRFAHRGIMLDVSRHFFTKEEVKRMIDRMAMYKLNRFHWHLTDEGGWRFEVEDYPELTRKAAFRTHHSWQEWWKNGGKFVSADDDEACGGYYTKEDIREIVEYAADRYVAIIPEVEFPGHSGEVFAAYPELCCTGEPYSSATFCVGNENTYAFMKSALNTVMDMFPSEMIHIGGDETNTTHWNNCPKCQELMKRERMNNVHELHNYIIGEAEKIIKARGRRMIGWDEIASDKLDKSSIIMSWSGEEAGINAVKEGYDVVLTPLHYLYLDYYQASPDKEPFAHDGYTPVEKVYTYNPIPDSLNENLHSHVLGIQGNLWTEWISNQQQLEYMAFPRTLAVAEKAWSPEERCSWDDFRNRLTSHIDKLKNEGVNTYTLSADVEPVVKVDSDLKKLEVSLKCERNDVEIRYTVNGTFPDKECRLYNAPLVVNDSMTIKAAAFKEGIIQGDVFTHTFYSHKAIGKEVATSMSDKSGNILADGHIGSKTYLDGSWLNFSGDQELLLDLGKMETIHSVSTRWMQLRAGAKRYLPEKLEILFSSDGITFSRGGIIQKKALENTPVLQYQNYLLEGDWFVRYIKIKVESGRGGMSVDEIIVL